MKLKLNIKGKIVAAAVCFVALSTAIGVVGYLAIQHLTAANREAASYAEGIRYQVETDMFHDGLASIVNAALIAGLRNDRDGWTAARAEVAEMGDEMKEDLERVAALPLAPAVLKKVAAAIQPVDDYIAGARQIVELAFDKNDQALAEKVNFNRLFDRLEVELEALADVMLERAKAAQQAAETEAALSQQSYEELRDARKRELDRMQEALAEIVETERTPLGMVMRLGEDRLQFDFDKARIRGEDKELLSRIAGVLLASRGYRLYVYGYTDDQGPANYNEQLSARRAEAVRKYFADAGIPEDIMESKGLGEKDPRVKGTSAAARQKNRRVEIGTAGKPAYPYRGSAPDRAAPDHPCPCSG